MRLFPLPVVCRFACQGFVCVSVCVPRGSKSVQQCTHFLSLSVFSLPRLVLSPLWKWPMWVVLRTSERARTLACVFCVHVCLKPNSRNQEYCLKYFGLRGLVAAFPPSMPTPVNKMKSAQNGAEGPTLTLQWLLSLFYAQLWCIV